MAVDDHRTTRVMQQLNVWRDELLAWFKTLFSAAMADPVHTAEVTNG